MFFWNACFFDDATDVGDLISSSSAFAKPSLNIWKFLVQVLLKPYLENFEHYFFSMWDECNCAMVWAFFDIAFLCGWNQNWPFPVLWPLLSFPNLLAYWRWCWEWLKVRGEGDDRGWDGRMASSTQWIWVWVNPRSWWWTRKPGVLQSMGSQRVGHNWATELNWTDVDSDEYLRSP